MPETTIGPLVARSFLSLTPDTPMRDAVARMVERQTSAAPVVDEDGRLIGILSQKDCFRAALNSAYYQRWSDTVGQHMSREVVTLDHDLDVVSAAGRFLSEPYRSYPVMRDGDLAGMLTRADLLAAFLALG